MEESESKRGLNFLNSIKKIVDNDSYIKTDPYVWIDNLVKKFNIPKEWASHSIISEYFAYCPDKRCKLISNYKSGIKFTFQHINESIKIIDQWRRTTEENEKRKSEIIEEQKRIESKKRDQLINDAINNDIALSNLKKRIRRYILLEYFSDDELIRELKNRGYKGELNIVKSKKL